MRLIHAARLSRTRDDSTGFDRQDEQALTYSAAYGHEIVNRAVDSDVSGSTDPMQRPALGPYLTDPVLMSTYQGIIAATLDRLGRNARHLVTLRNWAEDNGKKLIVVSPPLQWPPAENDLSSGIVWDILGRLAEYELAAITKRNRETQAWLKANNYLQGKPPYGYMVGERDSHKTLVPDPETAPVVKEIVNRYLKGSSPKDICLWLDGQGVDPPEGKSGKGWDVNSLRRMLRSPVLMGRRKNAQGVTELTFDGIITPIDYARLQAEIQARSAPGGKVRTESLLTGGIVLCAKCEQPLRFQRSTVTRGGKAYEVAYYRCKGSDKHPSQCRNMVRVIDADANASSFITDVLGSQKLIERVMIPANDHSEVLADLDAQAKALDFTNPDERPQLMALLAEIDAVKALPVEPPRLTERDTGFTLADYWAAFPDVPSRRAFLLNAGIHFYASKDQFTAEVETGKDWIVRPVSA